MTSLTWQTLALLAVTYFLGCCVGCFARRSFSRRSAGASLPQTAEPLVVAVAGGAAHQAVAGRAATPAPQPVTVARSMAPAAEPVREPFRRADTDAPQVGTAADADDRAARFAEALESGGRRPAPQDQHEQPEQRKPPEQTESPEQLKQPEEQQAVPVAEPAAAAADDFKRIRAIDETVEARLKELGVTTFAAIAQWTAADTQRVSRELGFKGRIEQENWIEQAQILARGGETRYSQRMAKGEAAAAQMIEDEGEPRPPIREETPVAAAAPPHVADRAAFSEEMRSREIVEDTAEVPADPVADTPERPAAVAMRDNLQRISGINQEIEALLARQGVTRYTQIASWTPADTERFDSLLGQEGRIARENWIEQAQILARGGDTAFSRDYDRAAGGEAEEPPAAGRPSDLGTLRSVRSEAYRPAQETAARGAHPAAPDDLKRIRGIGLLIEKRLHGLGVSTYEHIANWTAADIERVSRVLDFKGRIERENWVEQARILASGGQTEFSRRIDRGTAGPGSV